MSETRVNLPSLPPPAHVQNLLKSLAEKCRLYFLKVVSAEMQYKS